MYIPYLMSSSFRAHFFKRPTFISLNVLLLDSMKLYLRRIHVPWKNLGMERSRVLSTQRFSPYSFVPRRLS